MQEVVPGLFIGDFASSQDYAALRSSGILNVVAATRQRSDSPADFLVHRVLVDDVPSANIISSFPESNNFIHDALSRGEKVLVHCVAGQSRSATLLAAYLLQYRAEMTTGKAIELIRSVRPTVEPSEAFVEQLEMYERSLCEWNPSKWPDQRRFLMRSLTIQVLDGADPSTVLSAYPSPTVSTSTSQNLDDNDSSSTDATTSRIATSRSADKQVEADGVPRAQGNAEGGMVITGRRIRCKMCRRELAGREHILEHETGKGQHAFAPRRRDMSVYRAEQEKYRVDEKAREERERLEDREAYQIADALAAKTDSTSPPVVPTPIPTPLTSTPVVPTPPPVILAAGSHPAIAGLRISMPKIATLGLRAAVARPRTPLLTPKSIAAAAAAAKLDPSPPTLPLVDDSPLPTATPTPILPPTGPEPPLLPSHLCSSYFVEPMSWMSATLDTGILAGRLVCPNVRCGAKIGSYDWAGSQCSCGAWVCPGFAIGVAKVDEIA